MLSEQCKARQTSYIGCHLLSEVFRNGKSTDKKLMSNCQEVAKVEDGQTANAHGALWMKISLKLNSIVEYTTFNI